LGKSLLEKKMTCIGTKKKIRWKSIQNFRLTKNEKEVGSPLFGISEGYNTVVCAEEK
jgi:hypothetical protein